MARFLARTPVETTLKSVRKQAVRNFVIEIGNYWRIREISASVAVESCRTWQMPVNHTAFRRRFRRTRLPNTKRAPGRHYTPLRLLPNRCWGLRIGGFAC